MIDKDIKKSQFYCENTNTENKLYFDKKQKKYIHTIDTIYYSVFIKDDNDNNKCIKDLIQELQVYKDKVKEIKQNVVYKNDILMTHKRFTIYEYCLENPDRYDIFISDYLPNENTPRIVVQLRSFSLWVSGINEIIKESFKCVLDVLKKFDLEVDFIRENRLDYCYHTNSIQDAYKHFSDKVLKDYMVTNLDKYNKVGNIGKNVITLDYLALGQRKSNNVFVRIYNKTREVIEEGYKSFFYDIWFKNGLISFYDKFCYEWAYQNGNQYNNLNVGRLQFYIKYGKDHRTKREIELTLSDKNITAEQIKNLADMLMPKVTIIMNIEYQTKRKFYYYSDRVIDGLEVHEINKDCDTRLLRLFKVIDNRKIWLDYMTSTTLSFMKNDKYMDWWNRLRNLKIENTNKIEVDKLREYNNKLDKEKILKKCVRAIATTALYAKSDESDFITDLSDMLCGLNDNDMKNLRLFKGDTGELIDNIDSNYLQDYAIYKEKKFRTIKNRLPKTVINNNH